MDKVLVLDLEMAQPSNKIIQIGVVVASIVTGEIEEERGWFIKIDEILTPYITTLTGITDIDLVEKGVSLDQAFSELAALHAQHKCFVNLVTWGGGDGELLQSQISETCEWRFGRRWIDVKTVFISYCLANNIPFRGGLSKSLNKLKLSFQGRKHNAIDDSRNTFYIFKKLLELMKRD